MRWFEGITVRSILFGLGAIGAAAEAVDIAQRADIQITPAHLIALVCTALVAYAMKWPTDATKAEVKEHVARARRESMYPPPNPFATVSRPDPRNLTKEQVDKLVDDINAGRVIAVDEDKP